MTRAPILVTKCGAVRTMPLRTTPGKPTETRSKEGNGATSAAKSVDQRFGGHGYGVATRTRSATSLPSASSTEALRPVPPMSMASVVGRSGGTTAGAAGRLRAFSPESPSASCAAVEAVGVVRSVDGP